MTIQHKLQIILITYNRAKFVQRTFDRFFYKGSPVFDCDFLVLDNNSTDDTGKVVKDFMKKHPNVRYSKNRYNLGISGNIAKAMEVADKDYVWIIGDDDVYDFSNWTEVETAIDNNEKMICVARYAIPEEHKNEVPYQLFQLTFITGGIYSTSLFNDTTMRNTFDNIFTLFPHFPPILSFINNGGKIYVVDKPISDNGMNEEQKDCSYVRGYKNTNELYERTQLMSWILGYANIISILKDKELQQSCMDIAIPYPDIYGSWNNFYNSMYHAYLAQGKYTYFMEVYNALSLKHQKDMAQHILNTYGVNIDRNSDVIKCAHRVQNRKNKWYKKLFSIDKTKHHRFICVLGVKLNIGKRNNVKK